MAITSPPPEALDALDAPLRASGWSSLIASGTGLLGAVAALTAGKVIGLDLLLLASAWIAALVAILATSIALLGNRRRLLWTLLLFWQGLLAGASLFGAYLLVWGWPAALGALSTGWCIAAGIWVLLPTLAAGVLCYRATPRDSRARSIANALLMGWAVIVLLVASNLAMDRCTLTANVETTGVMGLDERTTQILQRVERPLRITTLCPAAHAEGDSTQARRDRQLAIARLTRTQELLRDMQRLNGHIIIADASSEEGRSSLLTRLRDKHDTQSHQARLVLEETLQSLPALSRQLGEEANLWKTLPANAYIAQWNVAPTVINAIGKTRENVAAAVESVKKNLAAPLPNYTAALAELLGTLRQADALLVVQTRLLQQLQQVGNTVAKNTPAALRDFDAATDTLAPLAGNDIANPPAGQSKTALKQAVLDLGAASLAIRRAAKTLDDIAGSDGRIKPILATSQPWLVNVQQPASEGKPPTSVRTTRSGLIQRYALRLDQLRADAAIQCADGNDAARRRMLTSLSADARAARADLTAQRAGLADALRRLGSIDPKSAVLLDAAQADTLFAELPNQLKKRIQQARAILDAPASRDAIPEQLRTLLENPDTIQDSLVLEFDAGVQVVPFAQAWPIQAPIDASSRVDEPRRFCNVGPAVSAALLRLLEPKPFARVLITFLREKIPPQWAMRVRRQFGPIPPQSLQTVANRLRDANFAVDFWNLATPLPEAADKSLPVVLLVVPPPPPQSLPGGGTINHLGPKYLDKLQNAIDRGASAMFLGGYMLPRRMLGLGQPISPPYHFNAYLTKHWGLTLETDCIVISGIPVEVQGGMKYRLDPMKLPYMPINSFSDQPIGRPLRGRYLYWPLVCPITQASPEKMPAGVQAQPILTIPASQRQIWGECDLMKLQVDARTTPGNLIAPNYDEGDLPAPLHLAFVAQRQATQDKPATRLVIVGVGAGLRDSYLHESIPQLAGGFQTNDPPRANVELVVNSVYWLVGRPDDITRGPMLIEPVGAMSDTERLALWLTCVLAIPVAILLGGAVVLLRRKR